MFPPVPLWLVEQFIGHPITAGRIRDAQPSNALLSGQTAKPRPCKAGAFQFVANEGSTTDYRPRIKITEAGLDSALLGGRQPMTEEGHGPAFCEQKRTTAEGSEPAVRLTRGYSDPDAVLPRLPKPSLQSTI